MEEKKTSRLVWFDMEFTSLELEQADILQVSAMLTDQSLNRISPPGSDLNLFVAIEDESKLSPWVCEHLKDLLAKCRAPGAVPARELDARLCGWLEEWCGKPADDVSERPVLAGNSVHNDWFIMRRLLPRFEQQLHYRILDVSTLKIEWLRRGGEAFDKENTQAIRHWFPAADVSALKQHDAYFDIIASAAELAFYRAKLFAPAD